MTPQVHEQVSAGVLDLGIGIGPGGEPWLDDELVVVASPERAERVTFVGDRLGTGQPFVSFVPGAAVRGMLERHFPEAEVVVELASIAAVKGHVRAGIGLALLSRHAIQNDLDLGLLVEVPEPRTPLVRQLVLHHAGLDAISPAARALREWLLQS